MAPNVDALLSNPFATIEALHVETRRNIMALRGNAAAVGWHDMVSVFGDVPQPQLIGLEDARRAGRYSDRLVSLARNSLHEPDVLARLDNRLATIAISENSQAFNQSRRRVAEHISIHAGMIEIWDAMMDACEICWGLNGSEAIVGRGFPSGSEPGMVHPRCQCTSHFEYRH